MRHPRFRCALRIIAKHCSLVFAIAFKLISCQRKHGAFIVKLVQIVSPNRLPMLRGPLVPRPHGF